MTKTGQKRDFWYIQISSAQVFSNCDGSCLHWSPCRECDSPSAQPVKGTDERLWRACAHVQPRISDAAPFCSPHLPKALRVPCRGGWLQLPSVRSLDPPHSSQLRVGLEGSRSRPSSPGQDPPPGRLCSRAPTKPDVPLSSFLTQRSPPSPFASVAPTKLWRLLPQCPSDTDRQTPLQAHQPPAGTQTSLITRQQWQCPDGIEAGLRPFLPRVQLPTPRKLTLVAEWQLPGWVSL